MKRKQDSEPRQEADQTVRLQIDTKDHYPSIRISFTDQRLTAHGGMIVWSHFLHQKRFRKTLQEHLPHQPTSPNAYTPTDIGLGFLGGILAGADKLSRVAWLQSDPAVAEVLGIEAVASQPTLSRFFGAFTQKSCSALGGLYTKALFALPSRKEGYTLDLDSWALLHEDGHQEGVATGYTKRGIKPCQRPLIAALAERPLVANYWLRSGNTQCVNGAAQFLRVTLAQLPSHIHIGLLRTDSGFGDGSFLDVCEEFGLQYIVAARLTQPVQSLCRHEDSWWKDTEVDGVQVQEAPTGQVGRRLILIRQCIATRPEAGGKVLIDVPRYRFQSLTTNLPASVDPLSVWRRYHGRADIENRIRELGQQFGIKGLTGRKFWATEAMHHLAIAAYNLCVLLQGKLGQLEKCELHTLRWRLFSRAAVWSRAQGKPTLKLAVRGQEARDWWRQILDKLLALPNCNSVGSLQA
jgi:hypothetical protein